MPFGGPGVGLPLQTALDPGAEVRSMTTGPNRREWLPPRRCLVVFRALARRPRRTAPIAGPDAGSTAYRSRHSVGPDGTALADPRGGHRSSTKPGVDRESCGLLSIGCGYPSRGCPRGFGGEVSTESVVNAVVPLACRPGLGITGWGASPESVTSCGITNRGDARRATVNGALGSLSGRYSNRARRRHGVIQGIRQFRKVG